MPAWQRMDSPGHELHTFDVHRARDAPVRARVLSHAQVLAFAEASRFLIEAQGEPAVSVSQLLACRLAVVLDGGCVVRLPLSERVCPVGASHADPQAAGVLHDVLAAQAMAFEDAFAEEVRRTRRSVWMPEVNAQHMNMWTTPDVAAYFRRFAMHSLLVTPVVAKSRRVVGSLMAWRDRSGGSFTEDELLFTEQFAARIAADLVTLCSVGSASSSSRPRGVTD
jgi:GAF domain-containing protein